MIRIRYLQLKQYDQEKPNKNNSYIINSIYAKNKNFELREKF